MLMDMLILFAVITIILFILSVFTVDENPALAIPFIIMGMIFCILCAYGSVNIETLYIGYNATYGNSTAQLHSTLKHGEPYGYMFMTFFFIYTLLFFKAAVNVLKESAKTKGEIRYSLKDRHNRRR